MESCNSEKNRYRSYTAFKSQTWSSSAEFLRESVMLLLFHGPAVEELRQVMQDKKHLKRNLHWNEATYTALQQS
jgi:hypothetical protein